MSIVDTLGTEAKVGDEVLFGQAGKGAQELLKGVVTKINEKTVTIDQWKKGTKLNRSVVHTGVWEGYEYSISHTRKNKCFVITSYAE